MSFVGSGIPFPVGLGGINGSKSPSKISAEFLASSEGVDLDGDLLIKEGGASKLNATPFAGEVLTSQTKALLHFDGVDASTTITDNSTSPKTWTAAGNAQIDTAQSVFGGASLLLDGTGDWVSTPDHADFTLGSGAFTIDFWFNCSAAGGTAQRLAGQAASGLAASTGAWYVERHTTNVIRAHVSNGTAWTTVTGTTTFTATGWHHVALVRTGNVLKLFIDGVQEGGDVAFTGSVNDSANNVRFGAAGEETTSPWTGWIDEGRIIVGTARWTAAFTPPAIAYSNSTTAPKVLAGINWSPGISNNDDVVFLSNGELRKDTGLLQFSTVLASGLAVAEDPPPWFVVAGGEASGQNPKLFLFSSAHQVRMVDGTANTSAAITTPASDWASAFPSIGCQHALRLWGAGNSNQPHRLYYSQTADHQNFTGAGSGSIAVFPGEGSMIAGMISFRGLLVVWKYPAGIYTVDTRDITPANWTVQRVTSAIGAVNQQCILAIENDIIWLDASGNVHRLSTTTDIGDVLSSNISEVNEIGVYLRDRVSFLNLRRSCGVWYGAKRKAYFIMPPSGSAVPTLKMMVDFAKGLERPRFLPTTRDIALCAWLRSDSSRIRRPIFGDNAGFAWQMDQDARNKDGADYTFELETAEVDFGFADRQIAGHVKQNMFMEITADVTAALSLQMTPIWDNIPHAPIFFNIGANGDALDSFALDSDALASAGTATDRKQIPGSGRRFRFKLMHAGVNIDVRLASFMMDLTIADERIRK